ncbi:MAG: hypothetical protein AAB225_28860 [Acidobacteriota bacterium]
MNRREALFTTVAGLAVPGGLPTVKLGPHNVSRLIVGGNPVSGNSHLSGGLGREMTDYFTAANVKRLLKECEEAGINTWQSRGDRHILRLLNEYRLEGGRIQWIAQTASELADIPRHIRELASRKPAGIYHHGSRTDAYWKAGKIEEAREMLKVMRDTGVQVGLGTHIPEVVDYVESKAWDLDFYMTCVYNLSRSKEEAERLAGRKVEDELFWDPDREQMLKRVRQTAKPCLIFKVYGASRKCGSREEMLAALRLAVRYAKPIDCVVIGMFPKRTEQVRENCALAAEAFRPAT